MLLLSCWVTMQLIYTRIVPVRCNGSNKTFEMFGLIKEFSPTLNQDGGSCLYVSMQCFFVNLILRLTKTNTIKVFFKLIICRKVLCDTTDIELIVFHSFIIVMLAWLRWISGSTERVSHLCILLLNSMMYITMHIDFMIHLRANPLCFSVWSSLPS
jgi:hypothetical protein